MQNGYNLYPLDLSISYVQENTEPLAPEAAICTEIRKISQGCRRGHDAADKNKYGHCLKCQRERRATNAGVREKQRELRNRIHKTDSVRRLLLEARRLAKKEKREFNLAPRDLKPFPTHCPILGLRLDYQADDRANSAGLIRRVPAVGYLAGNAVLVSQRAAELKRDGTVEEIENLLVWMKTRLTYASK